MSVDKPRGKYRCSICGEKTHTAIGHWQLRQVAAGRCRICGVRTTKKLCPIHQAQHVADKKRRRLARATNP